MTLAFVWTGVALWLGANGAFVAWRLYLNQLPRAYTDPTIVPHAGMAEVRCGTNVIFLNRRG